VAEDSIQSNHWRQWGGIPSVAEVTYLNFNENLGTLQSLYLCEKSCAGASSR